MTIEQVRQMSDEQICVKIAELLGYRIQKTGKRGSNTRTEIWKPDGSFGCLKAGVDNIALTLALADVVPDYPHDLNAMHEAEMTLSPERRANFRNWLETLVSCVFAIHATARQRAEAFILTVTN